ncbi:hypothetical protein AMATHDRAFT_11126 [Amanita thiersii Skay4041]|uniref:Uncharacterized protein n=1 Tax=Amanita thiersii Skay4041 TaxID=703135 RepID=A0A2A9N616_9AGAR|nr:hypothetical protein AMATHDRAFT_11126 [Amanita thiersii Skay4041]
MSEPYSALATELRYTLREYEGLPASIPAHIAHKRIFAVGIAADKINPNAPDVQQDPYAVDLMSRVVHCFHSHHRQYPGYEYPSQYLSIIEKHRQLRGPKGHTQPPRAFAEVARSEPTRPRRGRTIKSRPTVEDSDPDIPLARSKAPCIPENSPEPDLVILAQYILHLGLADYITSLLKQMVIDTLAKAVPEGTPVLPANKSKKRSASSGPSNLSRPSTPSPSVSDTSTKVNNGSSPVSKRQKSSPVLAFGDSKDIMDARTPEKSWEMPNESSLRTPSLLAPTKVLVVTHQLDMRLKYRKALIDHLDQLLQQSDTLNANAE